MSTDILPITHNESRVFTSYPGSKYVIPADETERIRLIRQHYMLKKAYDNKLVLPPISIKPGDEVLDNGTGTGIWLLDFAAEVPSTVKLYGADIESRNFPPQDTRPANTQFSIASLLDLPSEWTSKFTLIHQRLVFAVAIPRADIPPALSQLHRVLKPGGWVQLLEPGDWIAGPVNDRHKNLIRTGLPKHYGCRSTHVQWKWAGEEGIVGRNNLMTLWRGVKVPILDNGGFGFVNSEEEMDQLLDDLEKEMDETEGAKVDWITFYAQKPE
ncbi:hypothetical protein BDQ17DRAFT_1368401 [Cyathus striatus]|nr:hypothetical protein BDQ17DRAFT_1368401 [Cyathus striatus]